ERLLKRNFNMLYLYSMIGRTFALISSGMQFVHRAFGRWRSRQRPRYALALAGGGVIGGMYEVGALAALEERLNGSGHGFDIYVGCSAGSVVASLLAGVVRHSRVLRSVPDQRPRLRRRRRRLQRSRRPRGRGGRRRGVRGEPTRAQPPRRQRQQLDEYARRVHHHGAGGADLQPEPPDA